MTFHGSNTINLTRGSATNIELIPNIYHCSLTTNGLLLSQIPPILGDKLTCKNVSCCPVTPVTPTPRRYSGSASAGAWLFKSQISPILGDQSTRKYLILASCGAWQVLRGHSGGARGDGAARRVVGGGAGPGAAHAAAVGRHAAVLHAAPPPRPTPHQRAKRYAPPATRYSVS